MSGTLRYTARKVRERGEMLFVVVCLFFVFVCLCFFLSLLSFAVLAVTRRILTCNLSLSLSLPPPHNQITGTAFEGGIYHGRILLPVEYPFKPPNFMLLTPNGRFETLTKICLSITSYHAEHLATELVGEDGVDGDSSVYGDTERRRVRWD